MRYRIKIVTFKTGRQLFYPQVKRFFGWKGISSDGEECQWGLDYDTREMALRNIDRHYAGNSTVDTIEFEYISK